MWRSLITDLRSSRRPCVRQMDAPLPRKKAVAVAVGLAVALSIVFLAPRADAQTYTPAYENMPAIPPIGIRIGKYMDVPESAKGPAIDAAKGYRIQTLGKDLYMVTENAYQAMFLVYEDGVVLVDAPQTLASAIPKAIAEVTNRPITHLVYSHSHTDHIGGAASLGGRPIIIAHEETKKLLARANDPQRPLPTTTFTETQTLNVGSHKLELSYHGNGHEPGNIFIYAPSQKTLMAVDIIFPGWMMWRRFAVAQDVPGLFHQVEMIKTFDFETLVAGHVARSGTRADVELQSEFMNDLKAAAATGLQTTRVGEGVDPRDMANPWALYDNYIDRVVIHCVNALTPKRSQRLAAFDAYIWDQCYAMEQSLRID